MAERDAQSLQIGLGQIGQGIEIDRILGKGGRVLREPDPIKPSRYLVIDTHCRTPTNIGSRCASLWRLGAGVIYAWSRSIWLFPRLFLALQIAACMSRAFPFHRPCCRRLTPAQCQKPLW